MKKHKVFIVYFLLTIIAVCCKKETQPKINTVKEKSKSFKIEFDKRKISKYTIEKSEIGGAKTIVGRISNYTSKELENLPSSKRITLSITIPYNISKENLKNTLKSIVYRKTKENPDIDEIIIFAYDNKKDIGNGYTFGKLLWAPNGKTGMMTTEIVLNNDRSAYKFNIIIKDKVGNIKKEDLPSKRELEIYNETMSEKYWDMQEEEFTPIILKKFKISKKEFDEIFHKVALSKM